MRHIIVLILLGVAGFAYFAGVGIAAAINDLRKSRHNAYSQANKHQAYNGSQTGTASVSAVEDKNANPCEASRESKSDRDWLDFTNLIILYFAFSAALIAAWENYRLANLTHIAIKHADDSATVQHQDTLAALALTKISADAAAEANRAWIAPRFVGFDEPPEAGKPIKTRIIYENTGHSPALQTEFRAIGRVIKTNDGSPLPPEAYRNFKFGPNLACQAPIQAFSGAVYPASTLFGNVSHFDIGTGDPIVLNGVPKRNVVAAVQGCYRYRTMGGWHFSSFCYYLEPQADKPLTAWEFKGCGDGSDAK